MDTGILLGAAVGCTAGSILPWINVELVLLGAAVALPTGGLPTLVAVCVVARMLAKSTLYGVTRWAPERLPRRAREALGRAERFKGKRRLLTAPSRVASSACRSCCSFARVQWEPRCALASWCGWLAWPAWRERLGCYVLRP
jgi:hypothetical protein